MRALALAIVGIGSFVLATASPATAGTIVALPGIYSTGVDGNLAAKGNLAPETHWRFATPDSVPTISDGSGGLVPTASLDIVVRNQPNPDTPTNWAGNASYSAWIGPNGPDPAFEPIGRYYYSLSFTIPSTLKASTASLEGWMFGDDGVADVRLNTTQFGIANFDPNDRNTPFTYPYHFTIGSGFVQGENFLEFRVDNSGGPTGFRVQLYGLAEQVATPTPFDVPEPVPLTFLGGGFLGLALTRLRVGSTGRSRA